MTLKGWRTPLSTGFALTAAAVLVALVLVPCRAGADEGEQPVSTSRQGDDTAGLTAGEESQDDTPEKTGKAKKDKEGRGSSPSRSSSPNRRSDTALGLPSLTFTRPTVSEPPLPA